VSVRELSPLSSSAPKDSTVQSEVHHQWDAILTKSVEKDLLLSSHPPCYLPIVNLENT
jgi:hypothetical protein